MENLVSDDKTSFEFNDIVVKVNALVSLLCNYSGTLTPTNWKIFYNFINNLPIYKSFQQQVLKLLSHDTINIPVRGRNLVKSVNA